MRRAPHLSFWLSLFVALILQLVALPDAISVARPLWIPLVIAFWAMHEPRVPSVLAAFLFGILSDVLFNAVLGQHALGLVLLAYTVAKLRVLLAMAPVWQSTLALAPVWAAYTFLLFYIDGISRHMADPWLRWVPVASTTVIWPLVYWLLQAIAYRRRREED